MTDRHPTDDEAAVERARQILADKQRSLLERRVAELERRVATLERRERR